MACSLLETFNKESADVESKILKKEEVVALLVEEKKEASVK